MESSSATSLRRRVPWQGLLLAVSLFTLWSPPTAAQISVASVTAAAGSDVVLRLCNTPPDVVKFKWYRGEVVNPLNYIGASADKPPITFNSPGYSETGPAYTKREKMFYNGPLKIPKATVEDTGYYTVVAHLKNAKQEIGVGRVDVYGVLTVPTLIASTTTATEHKDLVVLTCNTDAISMQWLFNGVILPLTERFTMSRDKKTLTISPVRLEDAGTYQCNVSNPNYSSVSAPITLDVGLNHCPPPPDPADYA